MFSPQAFVDFLQPAVQGKLKAYEPLSPMTRLRVGGKADIFFSPKSREDLLVFLQHYPTDEPLHIIGAGSNLLVRDAGVRGAVIRLGAFFAQMECTNDHQIHVGAACMDVMVTKFALAKGLGGLSFLRGIPGTIGGAISMNAGCLGVETKDVVTSVEGIERNGKPFSLQVTQTTKDQWWSYRSSHFEGLSSPIFLGATLRTVPCDPKYLQEEMQKVSKHRLQAQPVNQMTAGSTFRNPHPESAWRLIRAAGCDTIRIGDACMSSMHANFLINQGSARAKDCEELIQAIQERVLQTTGIALQLEIKILGEAA